MSNLSQKPGTGPVRKQKQQRKSHCSASAGTTSGSVSNQVDKRSVGNVIYESVGQQDLGGSVFHSDTQKSMCVSVQPGNNSIQNDSSSPVNTSSSVSSHSSSTLCDSRGRKNRKCNRNGRKRNQETTVIVDKVIEQFRVAEKEYKKNAFDLDSILWGLADFICKDSYDLKICDEWYKNNCCGLPYPYTMKGITKNYYGFQSERLLKEQVRAAYDYFNSLCLDQQQLYVAGVIKERAIAEDRKRIGNSNRYAALDDFGVEPIYERTDSELRNASERDAITLTPRGKNTATCSIGNERPIPKPRKSLQPPSTKPRTIMLSDVHPESLDFDSSKYVKLYLKQDKESGTFSKGRGKLRIVTSDTASEILNINQVVADSKRLTLDIPVSEQIIESVAVPKEPKEKPKEIPSGFTIRKRPCFLLRCIYSDEVFDSKVKFNHNSKSLRKAAKSGRLDYTHIPDKCVIPSLYSYLTRRRDISYSDYKTKVTHLHKLAKAWENDEMPLKEHKANSEMLNNYYLTIAKVANCTDIDLIVAEHKQDQGSFWSRLRLKLTKSKITSG